jgi:Fe-S-cluster containining protein
MDLITDLEEIKRLSEEKEEENWGFRSFLKSGVITTKKIDLIAKQLYKKIASKIDCTECGNCCRALETQVKESDIDSLAKHLKLSVEEFKSQYVIENQEGKLLINKMPCPFLSGNKCSVYSARPEDCRSYPHIQNKSIVPRLISMIHNCSVCPIVYNFYEELKQEIWSMNDGFDVDEDDYL